MLTSRQRNLVIGVLAVLAFLSVAGLVLVLRDLALPGQVIYSPVAIRQAPNGEIEALYVPCDVPDEQSSTRVPHKLITGFGLDAGTAADADERDRETVWQLSLDQPTDLDSITLGEPPAAATEEVPWPEEGLNGFSDETLFTARFTLDDGTRESESFRPSDLDNQTVRFRLEDMTPEEFAETDRC